MSVKVTGNTALSEATFVGTLGKLGTDTYIVNSSETSVNATFTSTDPNAKIQCSGISGGAGIGSLSGDISLAAGTTTVTVTVTSNQDSATYTYKFTKLEQ